MSEPTKGLNGVSDKFNNGVLRSRIAGIQEKDKTMTDNNTVNTRDSKGRFTIGNQEGNRSGRPKKGFAITDILNARGKEIDEATGMTLLEKMLRKVYELATKDKPEKWAVEFIADRTEGKALERIDQTLKNEPIRAFDFDD